MMWDTQQQPQEGGEYRPPPGPPPPDAGPSSIPFPMEMPQPQVAPPGAAASVHSNHPGVPGAPPSIPGVATSIPLHGVPVSAGGRPFALSRNSAEPTYLVPHAHSTRSHSSRHRTRHEPHHSHHEHGGPPPIPPSQTSHHHGHRHTHTVSLMPEDAYRHDHRSRSRHGRHHSAPDANVPKIVISPPSERGHTPPPPPGTRQQIRVRYADPVPGHSHRDHGEPRGILQHRSPPPDGRVPRKLQKRRPEGESGQRSARRKSRSRSRSRSRERRQAHAHAQAQAMAQAQAIAQAQAQAQAYAHGHGRAYAPRGAEHVHGHGHTHGMESDRDIERRREAARADNIRGLDWGRGLEQFQHPQFLFSKCTGRKKALCIGINYAGQSRPLHGCVNDAKSVYRFLIKYYHYDPKNIILLTDDARNPRDQPTRANMLAAMRWLVKGARPHDSLFFHYSGHGGQTRDKNGDEVDGYDEIIFPVDYQRAGDIVDDDLHHIMVRPLPPGCRLTAVFDSCHSGSVLDLPYMYHSNGRLKGSDVAPRYKKIKATPAEVICWSGCKDSGTSADTQEGGLPVGAMSYAFLKVLKRNPKITYRDLLRGLKDVTRRYKQKPQLSAGHHIDTERRFLM